MLVMGIPARQVFWIAFSVAALPCLAFVLLSYIHFNEMLTHMLADHTIKTKQYLSLLETNQDHVIYSEDVARLTLEYDATWNRQNRTNSALASRTWLRFMTACFGSILVFIGAIYLLSKIGLSEPTEAGGLSEPTEAGASTSGIEFTFRSSSPGIVLVIVGASLMVFPHFASQDIESNDGNIYMLDRAPQHTKDTHSAKTPAERFGLHLR